LSLALVFALAAFAKPSEGFGEIHSCHTVGGLNVSASITSLTGNSYHLDITPLGSFDPPKAWHGKVILQDTEYGRTFTSKEGIKLNLSKVPVNSSVAYPADLVGYSGHPIHLTCTDPSSFLLDRKGQEQFVGKLGPGFLCEMHLVNTFKVANFYPANYRLYLFRIENGYARILKEKEDGTRSSPLFTQKVRFSSAKVENFKGPIEVYWSRRYDSVSQSLQLRWKNQNRFEATSIDERGACTYERGLVRFP
jgi:hypothetical protein